MASGYLDGMALNKLDKRKMASREGGDLRIFKIEECFCLSGQFSTFLSTLGAG